MNIKSFFINNHVMVIIKIENSYEFYIFNANQYSPISYGTIDLDGKIKINLKNAIIEIKMPIKTINYNGEIISPKELKVIGEEIIDWMKR